MIPTLVIETDVLKLHWVPELNAAYGIWAAGTCQPAHAAAAYEQVQRLLATNQGGTWISDSTAVTVKNLAASAEKHGIAFAQVADLEEACAWLAGQGVVAGKVAPREEAPGLPERAALWYVRAVSTGSRTAR